MEIAGAITTENPFNLVLHVFHIDHFSSYIALGPWEKKNSRFDCLPISNLSIGVGTMGAVGAIVSIKFVLWGQHTYSAHMTSTI